MAGLHTKVHKILTGRGTSLRVSYAKCASQLAPSFLSKKLLNPGTKYCFAQQKLCVAMFCIAWHGEAWRSKSRFRWPWRARFFNPVDFVMRKGNSDIRKAFIGLWRPKVP